MKYTSFFEERVPNLPSPNDKGEVMVPCVFHKDSSPSLGINLESGKWKCFAAHCPGHGGGGYKKFEALLNGENITTGGGGVAHIDKALVDSFHTVLLGNAAMMELLLTKRGLFPETVKHFKLGFDSDRIWIPIQDDEGNVVNVRKYKPGAKKDKVIPFAAGYNRARLFPVAALEHDWIVLFEGEMDCILATQLGLPAVTGTGGADTWPAEFTKQFVGKRVTICYDTDKSGRKGASEVAIKLLPVAAEVRICTLPLKGTSDEKDLTDYVVKLHHTAEEVKHCLLEAELVVAKVADVQGPPAEVVPLHLSEVGQERHVGKRVSATVLVAGKDLAPFQVPRKMAFMCEMGERFCTRCGIAQAGGQREVTLPEWDPQLLQMVNVHQLTVEAVQARVAGVPGPCRKFRVEVKEHANIEAVKAIPEIDFSSERSEYVIRQLYYLGHGLETNHTYDIEAVVMPDPKTQYATAIIYKAESSKDNIEEFRMDDAMKETLSMFQVGK